MEKMNHRRSCEECYFGRNYCDDYEADEPCCVRPQYAADLVYGRCHMLDARTCFTERNDDGLCGPSGKYFVQAIYEKKSLWNRFWGW